MPNSESAEDDAMNTENRPAINGTFDRIGQLCCLLATATSAIPLVSR
jgi:hypothetical protein